MSKKAVLDASGAQHLCSLCGKPFKSQMAVYGHMRMHKTPQKQQAEELSSISLDLGKRKLDTTEGRETKGDGSALAEGGASSSAAEAQRKKIHKALDLNKEAPEDDDNDDGSALAEGGASSSAAEAQRKKIHKALDLNKEAPEDDDNDDEDYLGDNKVA